MAANPTRIAPEPAPCPLLEGRGVAFARRDEPIFGPLDFTLQRGEVLLVEGDNGSGKTTLLRLIAGLLSRGEGQLLLDGEPLTHDRARGEILLIGHQLGLKADLSPFENLRVTDALYGRRRGATPRSVLASIGLTGLEDEPVRRLSAGQKKRAALARLLVVPASLWLLDEPYANLDREGISLVNHLLEHHTSAGGAALVTSHGAVSYMRQNHGSIRLTP